MSTFDIPADLIDLQRRFLELDARCSEVSARLPRAVDIAAGIAEISDEQRARRAEMHAELQGLAQALSAHEWWDSVPPGGRYDARVALRAAAAF